MIRKLILRILNQVFLAIPAFLFLFSLGLNFIYGFSVHSNWIRLNIWRSLWHITAYFFILAGCFILFSFIKKDKKEQTGKNLANSFKFWLVGLVLSAFSYALASLLVDVGWLVYFVFLNLTKK
jgi:hypothetical protein